ncbi:MAG: 30S ribosomal protein S21 [Patescibacteria group bacterium]
MIEVKKKEGETIGNLIRRFSQKIKESGVLMRARSNKFKNRPLSDLNKKKIAIIRINRKKRLEYLKKLGKIE